MSQQPKYLFVSHRDMRVISTLGHTIAFKAGKPTAVPRVLHKEVTERGALPCDESGTILDAARAAEIASPPKLDLKVAPEDPVEREEMVVEAMRKLVARNDRSDFTGGGSPSSPALTMLLGWKIDAKDVRRVWEKRRKELLAEARK